LRRRRECNKCNQRFTTYEFIELSPRIKYKVLVPYEFRKARKPKQKPAPLGWLGRIKKMLDETEAREKILRQEI
jgi:hypothetical protein